MAASTAMGHGGAALHRARQLILLDRLRQAWVFRHGRRQAACAGVFEC